MICAPFSARILETSGKIQSKHIITPYLHPLNSTTGGSSSPGLNHDFSSKKRWVFRYVATCLPSAKTPAELYGPLSVHSQIPATTRTVEVSQVIFDEFSVAGIPARDNVFPLRILPHPTILKPAVREQLLPNPLGINIQSWQRLVVHRIGY